MRVKTIILQSTSDDAILDKINKTTSEVAPERLSTGNNVLQLIGLSIMLILILLAAYYTSKFVGGYKLGQLKDSNFKVIDIYRISTNKMLQIVKIADKYVVLGISKDQITYIMELDESEVLTHEDKGHDKQSFRQILDKIKGNKE